MKSNDNNSDNKQLSDWLSNFLGVFPDLVPSLGIKPAKIAVLKALVEDLIHDLNDHKKEDRLVNEKEVVKHIVALLNQIKEHVDYKKFNTDEKLNVAYIYSLKI